MVKKLFLIIVFLFLILVGLHLFSSLPSSEKPTPTTPRLVQKKNLFYPSPLTSEAIFDSTPAKTATLSAEKVTTLVTTGDVGLVRSVNFQMTQKNDFTYPFTKTAEVLKNADLTLINLEGPLVRDCPPTNTGMIFCGDLRAVQGLVSAGVDLANLTNNHILDQGQRGLAETIGILSQNKITPITPEKIVLQDFKTQKFAFLGYEDINEKVDQKKIKTQIQEASSLADLVVVSFHWGTEYTDYPNRRQQDLAHLAIDNGADLIIGNHPHWSQPVEIYQGRLIVYSHGNFIFDQMWSQKTKQGIIGKYTFYENQLIDAEFFPVLINDSYQPDFLHGREKEVLLEDLGKRSDNLSGR